MAYDALAESIALIERGLPTAPPRLSRRRRFAALAVDVDGDVACTVFTVRAPGHFRRETHLLVRRGADWRVLGGGGGSGDGDGLADRPSTAELGAFIVAQGGGSVLRSDRLMPWGARYVSDAELLVSQDVVVAGSRVLPAPQHGNVVVVWAARRPPLVVARNADGRGSTEFRLSAPG